MTLHDKHKFIEFSMAEEALCLGEYRTKAGRLSPYFFNAGLFNSGESIRRLGRFYAETILSKGLEYDMLFGPAYKGIPLVVCVAVALAEKGHSVGYAFNRKEKKSHGEGGDTVGARLEGKVLIVDDVVSGGGSILEAANIIKNAGAEVSGAIVALDRLERGKESCTAAEELRQKFNIPIFSIAALTDLVTYLRANDLHLEYLEKIDRYRKIYGA